MIVRVLLVLAMLVGLAACDTDTSGEQPELAGEVTQPELGIEEAGEAEPAAGTGSGPGALVDGDFAEIPLPTSAEPLNAATTENDVTVQTFMVTASTVTQTLDYFSEELPALGWAEGSVDTTGNTDTGAPEQGQSAWTKEGQTLLVSAAELEQDDVQVSLQLSG